MQWVMVKVKGDLQSIKILEDAGNDRGGYCWLLKSIHVG